MLKCIFREGPAPENAIEMNLKANRLLSTSITALPDLHTQEICKTTFIIDSSSIKYREIKLNSTMIIMGSRKNITNMPSPLTSACPLKCI